MTIDIAALATDPKGTEFDTNKSAYKARSPREVVYANLVKDYEAFNNGDAKGKCFEIRGDKALFKLRYGNQYVPLKETNRAKNVFPSNVIDDVIAKVMDDVKDGVYDDELEALQIQYSANLSAAREKRANP